METNFNEQSILFQNNFYIKEEDKKYTFKIPNLKEIYGNEKNLEFLLSLLSKPVDKVSAIFFPSEIRVYKTIAELLVYAARKELLTDLEELVESLKYYAHITIEDKKLYNEDNEITTTALQKIFKSILQSLTSDFKDNISGQAEEDEKFVPPNVSNISDEFMKKMIIQEAEEQWKLNKVKSKKQEQEGNSISVDGIFAAVMEAFKLSLEKISKLNLYTLYWHYSKVHLIDNQIIMRTAQGNGLLDGKKHKYEYIIDK